MASLPVSDPSRLNGTSPRPSFDIERPFSPAHPLNGTANTQEQEDTSDLDPIQRLQRDLQRTKEEKDALAAQYRNLLSKLTAMRTTLGNKLKQDAVRSCLLPSACRRYDLRMHRKNSTVKNNLCSSSLCRTLISLPLWRLLRSS